MVLPSYSDLQSNVEDRMGLGEDEDGVGCDEWLDPELYSPKYSHFKQFYTVFEVFLSQSQIQQQMNFGRKEKGVGRQCCRAAEKSEGDFFPRYLLYFKHFIFSPTDFFFRCLS